MLLRRRGLEQTHSKAWGCWGPCKPGWAGPCAPEPHQHRLLLHRAPASHRLKDAEFGQCPNPDPSAGTEQGILLRPKSGFIITARPLCKQISPRWVPPGRFWGESHPAGLSPAGTGKAVLVLGAGRAPGPEAAAAQLIPALASSGTFCPCRPRDGHRLCVSRPRGTAQTASAAATGMAPSILRAGEGRGKGSPPKEAAGPACPSALQSPELQWGGGSLRPRQRGSTILGVKGKNVRIEEQSRGWGWVSVPLARSRS